MEYLWILPGRAVPPGYRATGVVSRWPDDGSVRSELWEAPLFDDVRQRGARDGMDEPTAALAPEAATAPPAREFPTVQERNT